MSKSRLIAGVSLDALNAIFYHADGSGTTILSTSDPRTEPLILEMVAAQKRGDVANLIFAEEDIVSYYESFNRRNKSGLRLFKVASRLLSKFWKDGGKHEVPFPAIGVDCPLNIPVPAPAVPLTPSPEPIEDQSNQVPVTQLEKALGLDNGSLRAPDMVTTEDVIVAVDENGQALPYMERLLTQFAEAFHTDDTTGVEVLIKRLMAVDDSRNHSVEDALTFIQRSDMRITVKGDLIGYKALREASNLLHESFEKMGAKATKGTVYVDAYSGKVVQRIGTLVQVNQELIDLNRRNECSNGLHVARRRYLRSWRQDACFLILLAPEDIFTVPHGDPNKVRVRAYQLLHKLTDEQYSRLLNDRPFTDDGDEEAKKVLGALLAGNYPDKTETVTINGQMGGSLHVEIHTETEVQGVETDETTETATGIQDVEVGEERVRPQVAQDQRVKVGAINKAVSAKAPLTNADKAKALVKRMTAHTSRNDRETAAKELHALKRKAKVSYKKLGLSDREIETLQKLLGNTK